MTAKEAYLVGSDSVSLSKEEAIANAVALGQSILVTSLDHKVVDTSRGFFVVFYDKAGEDVLDIHAYKYPIK